MPQNTQLSFRELIGPIILACVLSVMFGWLAIYSLDAYLDSVDAVETTASVASHDPRD